MIMTASRQRLPFAIACMAIAAATAQSQDVPQWQIAAGGKMAFEVASIKQSKPGTFRPPNFPLDVGDAYASVGGRFSADFALPSYIRFAYKLSLTQDQMQSLLAGLPKWVATDNFDIEARAEGNPTKDQMRLMMQSLLADRFKLAIHFETREMPVLALTVVKPGKLGPNLRPHADGPPCDASSVGGSDVFPSRCEVYAMTVKQNRTRMSGSRNTTMALLATAIPSFGSIGRPVVDQTGLTGKFDFTLEWTPELTSAPPPNPDVPPDTQGPTFLEALREQLGLKLDSTRAPLQILVVDHVERPTEN
jgi:uncharacterized protein (TIGR03435 family)